MNFAFTFIFRSTFTQVPYSYRLLFCNTGNLLKTLDTPGIFILLSFMQKEVVHSLFTNMFDTFDGYNKREKI